MRCDLCDCRRIRDRRTVHLKSDDFSSRNSLSRRSFGEAAVLDPRSVFLRGEGKRAA